MRTLSVGWRAWVVGAFAVVLAVVGVVPAAAQDTEPWVFDLAGTWKFSLEDDPSFRDPSFDDSGWEDVPVPASFPEIGHGDHLDTAWYRVTFTLPAERAGTGNVLITGPIEDADFTYVNGVLVGSEGRFPEHEDGDDSVWELPRLYPLATEGLLDWGGENTIAVRVHNLGPEGFDSGGGIFLGPVGIYSREAAREYEIATTTTGSATQAQVDLVTATLRTQAAAIAGGDVDAYLATLADGFRHDADDVDRRRAVVEQYLARGEGVTLVDEDVEFAVTPDGRIVADLFRSWVADNGTDLGRLTQKRWDVLFFDAATGQELGNHSRYFASGVWSEVLGAWSEVQVWLPPQYGTEPGREFPTTYVLHGANGGPREWEWRNAAPYDRIQFRYDQMFTTDGFEPMAIVNVDGGNGYGGDWPTMFTTELIPSLEASLGLVADRTGRAMSGFSLGGAGTMDIGFAHPDTFGSLASHAGVIAAAQVTAATSTPMFLQQFRYWLDSGADDAFRGGEQVRAMSAQLTAKLVEHEAHVVPGGHDSVYLAPALQEGLCSHSRWFQQVPYEPCGEVPLPAAAPADGGTTDPAPDPTTTPDAAPTATDTPAAAPATTGGPTTPVTGGGVALAAALAAVAATRRRR